MDMIDINPALVVTILCVCGGGVIILAIILSVVGGLFDIVTGGIDILMGLIGFIVPFDGGCSCGCVTLFLGCGLCGAATMAIISIVTTCGTPDAVNFCRLF